MPTYISLGRWTAQGAQSIKDSPARLDAAKKGFAAAGVKMIGFYMVTGAHDMVIITEAPDDATMAKATLRAISQGGVTTQTSRAFTEDEYRAIMSSL